MSTKNSKTQMIQRRGELIVELLLQDFSPTFIARPTNDIGYDFFVGFTNSSGGVNTFAVQFKATEQPIEQKFQVPRSWYNRLAHSNIPVLLLVVNVKENKVYYAWPSSDTTKNGSDDHLLSIPLTELDELAKKALRERLTE